MQGKGEFKKFSISTTLDLFISTILLYPISLVFGVVGIVFSRIAGISVLIYKYLTPMFREVNGEKIHFGINDINISVLLLGNFANIIMFLSRFVSGLDGSNNITFFNYSIVLLNVFLTAIIMNLNTIVLRTLSLKKEGRIIFFPATLKHTVYSFYDCEEERITLSGNIALKSSDEEEFGSEYEKKEKTEADFRLNVL